MSRGALSGITIIDLTRLLPGPWCTMVLADHGARVICLEAPAYEEQGAFPTLVNRNKEHMGVDLKTEEGRAIFYELVSKADVVVEGFRPGVTERLMVDYDAVKKVNSEIIYCSITGYGQTGPRRDEPGHDINYLSEAGALNLMGSQDTPHVPGLQVADIAGGSQNAITGILLALFHRERTGEGQHIDISITDGTLALMHLVLNMEQVEGKPMRRTDALLSHRFAFYNTYRTKNGEYLALGALEPKFWIGFCHLTGLEEYASLQFDEARRLEVIDAVRGLMESKTLQEWEALFSGHDICWSPVKSLSEAMESELFKEREMVVASTTPEGSPCQTIGAPVKLSKTPAAIVKPPFAFGADTQRLLAELGRSDDEIKTLREQQVIA